MALESIRNFLNDIPKLDLVVHVGFQQGDFVKGKRKVWRVLYWIALVIYIFGVVFGVVVIYIK